ncbi:COG1470 family protein [Alteribacillus bidgolensis]|uniref:NPCBM-associated, NEW3 domain of alpha-galactosidase n=1 Tax=Alteribacillus bidgolensis TaxID=930129 RepID=A0A1G8QKA0_9BACI|nr:NEW3 domain-containing protein [Alteribacillus bidgolensis]SDJ05088.1 NPCBM-associated, NEW3 domain of alpha-galactosidase [Alteribacillus bidgolensis]
MWKRFIYFILAIFVGGGVFPSSSYAATLYTPFTGISVTPGETVNYSVDLTNDSSSIMNTTFEMKDLPEDWNVSITSGGRDIEQLSVEPNGTQTLSVEIEVPLQVEKGKYQFELIANGDNGQSPTLSFLVNMTEEGTFKTELNSEQPNMEGHADSTFSYQATLKNRTAEEQHYALSADTADGWDVQFKSGGDTITSATLEPNSTKDIDVEITPPKNVKADTFTIPIKAATSSTSATAELEAVITGTYSLELSTPSGKLNTDITAGRDKTIDLQVTNNGTADIHDIKLSGQLPPNWQIEFKEDTIPTLEAGNSVKVQATIQASDEAIAGDYVANLKAESPEASSEAAYRISVETSVLWGFTGAAIILAVLGGLFYLFKKYGRR